VYVCVQVNRKTAVAEIRFHLIPPKEQSVFTNLTLSLKYIPTGLNTRNVPVCLQEKRKSLWEKVIYYFICTTFLCEWHIGSTCVILLNNLVLHNDN